MAYKIGKRVVFAMLFSLQSKLSENYELAPLIKDIIHPRHAVHFVHIFYLIPF